jgi:muramoyltetrapeptide carboxypeptidase
LSELQALVVGGFSGMKEGDPKFGKSAYEIINEAVESYTYPVVYNFPAGHINDNWTLPLGRYVKISVDEKEVSFNWDKR